jgi:L-amino acid N-acyltransferase YncA
MILPNTRTFAKHTILTGALSNLEAIRSFRREMTVNGADISMDEPDKIRIADIGDAEGMLAIYAPFCAPDSAVSFEIEPPTIDDMRERITFGSRSLHWIVCVRDNREVLGYAYASPHSTRAAYRWSVNVSIYLSPNARRQGIGKKLYEKLFALVKELGYVNAYAGITLPNQASEALHKALGFVEVGVYKQVGYKVGKWHDVVWFALMLRPHEASPAEPVKFAVYLHERIKRGEGPML